MPPTRAPALRSRGLRLTRALAFAAAAAVHVSCFPLAQGEDIDLSGQQVRLTLLHTSDIHSRLLPYDFNPLKTDVDLGLIPEAGPFGGATRMASLIKRERAKADRVIHLDSGDSFQGAPVFNVNLGEVEFKFLSSVGLDAAVIGNHEFDAGAQNFTKQARDMARFPLLVANYVWEDYNIPGSNQTALYTFPYTIKNVGGLKVGIVGLGNIGSLNSIIEQGNSLQAIPIEQNEAARQYVELLRPSVDLILIVSHAGLTEDQDLIEGYEAYYEYKVAQQFVTRAYDAWKVLEWFGTEGDPDAVVRVRIPGVKGVDAILGGHLHIVLNPPQLLTDPEGRKVILSHGGAFSKYLNRMDLVIQVPRRDGTPEEIARGAEILSHDFRIFPIDAVWCDDSMRDYYRSRFWNPGEFRADPRVQEAARACSEQEDRNTTQLLMDYILGLDFKLNLTSIFSYAPQDIARRNNSTGGDSPLGNMTADSMRRRRGIEAEVAITNSLGIRDNLYAGPLTTEAMFNVFPFENTINIMFLSGREMQELFDFIANRSAERGCASQAQISGARFVMDCAQVQLNAVRLPCNPANLSDAGVPLDCPKDDRSDRAPWECLADDTIPDAGGRCWAHTGTNITILGDPDQPLNLNETYRIAVNDYIAKGGSGFLVLKRNTTRVESGIPLRDSLIGYMQNFCTCEEILADQKDPYGNIVGKDGKLCGNRDPAMPSRWLVDEQTKNFCRGAKDFHAGLVEVPEGKPCHCADVFRGAEACGPSLDQQKRDCYAKLPPGPALGRCGCRDALAGLPECGNVPTATRTFCENPTRMPIAVGVEDGRITRRIR
ncbi:MAG: bifunctional UDP-sugar hydrolase/5'-nucleotidase [Myxococcota bacterium]